MATTGPTNEKRGEVLATLRELLAEGRTDDVLSVVSQLVARNSELERRLAQMLSAGRKNEGVPTAQLQLIIDKLEVEAGSDENGLDPAVAAANEKLREASGIDKGVQADAKEAGKRKRQPPLRRPIPASLPRVDNPIKVPDAERACPTCGAARVCIGHDVTEVVELVPAKLMVRRDVREKLGCETCDGEIVRAPTGDKVVDGGRLGSTLVGLLLVDKYEDGLPLHRQKQRFERMGLSLPISTLADQVTWATDLLRPLWRMAILKVVAAKVMHLDGTGLPVLDSGAPGGKRLGTLWGYVGEQDVAAYLYASTGKKVGQKPGELGPEDMLKLREGYTVADASGLFDASFERPELIECGCHMHARRYFTKALDAGDERAAIGRVQEAVRDRREGARPRTG